MLHPRVTALFLLRVIFIQINKNIMHFTDSAHSDALANVTFHKRDVKNETQQLKTIVMHDKAMCSLGGISLRASRQRTAVLFFFFFF